MDIWYIHVHTYIWYIGSILEIRRVLACEVQVGLANPAKLLLARGVQVDVGGY